jgi:hypothetical protein
MNEEENENADDLNFGEGTITNVIIVVITNMIINMIRI